MFFGQKAFVGTAEQVSLILANVISKKKVLKWPNIHEKNIENLEI